MDSVQEWVETTAVRLLEGERLLLRLPPRFGKTYLCRELGAALGPSALVVDGTVFTEATQADQRELLGERIRRALDEAGSVQILFDSYDRAVARSQGARLQAWLTSKIIDSAAAQDIGAFFTARCSTDLHRPGAGSPLISRVLPIGPPMIKHSDPEYGAGTPSWEWFGDSALLVAQAQLSAEFDPVSIADRIENDVSYLTDVHRAAARQIRQPTADFDNNSYGSRSAVHGLISTAGATYLLERVRPGIDALDAADPAWPRDWQASVDRFVQLVAGAAEVVWSDRYMYRDIEPLRAFLREVVSRTGTRVLLLGSETVSEHRVSAAELARLTTVPGVEARRMTPDQYRNLHERHLATGPGGWVLPQVHVLVGRQDPGSAVAAATAGFGVDYWEMWRSAST